MIGLIARVIGAVGLFAGVHSLLASRAARRRAAEWFGPRAAAGGYRVFFLAQSAVTLAALLAYLASLPDRVLYRARGPLALLLRLGQSGGLAFAFASAYQVGIGRILGLESLAGWLAGRAQVPPTPEAQGPAPVKVNPAFPWQAELRARGPFRLARHPLNFAPLPVFWLAPTMTVKRLAFNLAGTLYLILGSLHEEARLAQAYGARYCRYQRSGVPFFFPFGGE